MSSVPSAEVSNRYESALNRRCVLKAMRIYISDNARQVFPIDLQGTISAATEGSLYSRNPKPLMSLTSAIAPVFWASKCRSISDLVTSRQTSQRPVRWSRIIADRDQPQGSIVQDSSLKLHRPGKERAARKDSYHHGAGCPNRAFGMTFRSLQRSSSTAARNNGKRS